MLLNLLGNAIKFTEQGEIQLRVSEHERTPEQITLLFDVADTGIGISPEDQAPIFAPFAQADASTTREYGGSGLGLAICSDLIRMMGGRLWVESTPGEGSTFSFTAQFRPASEEGSSPQTSSEKPSSHKPASQGAGESASKAALLRDLAVLVVGSRCHEPAVFRDRIEAFCDAPSPGGQR